METKGFPSNQLGLSNVQQTPKNIRFTGAFRSPSSIHRPEPRYASQGAELPQTLSSDSEEKYLGTPPRTPDA
ncbi:MAG: hypothetical protein ACJAUP_000437 [Cellvibrionaceae bacterium]